MAWQDQADASTLWLLQTFNHQPEWRQTNPPNTIMTVRGHRRWFGSDELELLNAYGVRGCEIIVDLATFNGDQPAKFDQFVVGDDRFTVNMVRPTEGYANALLIARLYCKGD